MIDLLMKIMDDLQCQLHAETRKQMDSVDRRGRVAELGREDKNALHELIHLAGKAVSFISGPSADHDKRIYDKSREVMEKLFR